MISDRVVGLRTDAEVRRFVNNATRKDEVAVIEFGASWCHHCHQVFPAFYALTKKVHLRISQITHFTFLVPIHALCSCPYRYFSRRRQSECFI